MVRIAAAQLSFTNDMEANLNKALDCIRTAAEQGARMICFPEGQLSEYLPQYPGLDIRQYAVTPNGPEVARLCTAAREHHILVCAGLCLREGDAVYAAALLLSEQGEVLGVSRKNHITRSEHFYEQDYFTPGPGGFAVADTSIGRVGMIVCFDRHYPESFRTCVLQGADFIAVPVANETTEPSELFRWEMRIPAFQNSVNLLMCNRVGTEGAMDFCGESVFVRADGSVAALADGTEQLLYADLDLEGCAELRRRMKYLPLRRPEVFLG